MNPEIKQEEVEQPWFDEQQDMQIVLPRKRFYDGMTNMMASRMAEPPVEGDVQEEKAFLLTNLNNGNRFANCYFPIRTSLPAGRQGLYKIVVNDIYFYCSQPFFVPGDEMQLYEVGNNTPIWVNKITENIEPEEVLNYGTTLQKITGIDPVVDDDGGISVTIMNALKITLGTEQNVIFENLTSKRLQLKMSGGYYHFFNYSKTTLDFMPAQKITFRGLNFNGPSFYIAQSGNKPLVSTKNDTNNQFNAIGIYYNYNRQFRDYVQMSGTMEILVSNPSNFRLLLVDDSGRELDLRSPVFVHLTISPY